jgi:DNA-binding PadR family transcriptional regulator
MSRLEGRIEKLETRQGYTLTQEQKDAVARVMRLRFPAMEGESEEARLRRVDEYVREDMRKRGCL